MVCKSCEERREWMRVQYERARKRTAKAINRIRGIADKDSGTEYRDWETDRKSTRLNSSHSGESRMPSSA